MENTCIKKGLRLKSMPGIDKKVRKACYEFAKWLRSKMEFPVRVTVYLKKEDKFKIKKGKYACAVFWEPNNRIKQTYIKLATGDYRKMKNEKGEYNSLMLILCSMSHEIIHYRQWIEGKPCSEKKAEKEDINLVLEYSNFKNGLLTSSFKEIAYLYKGDKLCDSGNYNKSIIYYEKSIKINPENKLAYYGKGYVLDCLERYEEAIKCYDKAIELEPEFETAYISKGYALDFLEKYIDALICYNKAIELNPKNETTYNNKGYSLYCLKRYDESVNCFEKAIEINPNNTDYYIYKGNSLKSLKRYQLSLECYNKAIELNPEYAEAYYNNAIVYNILGELDQVFLNLKKAIELDKEYKNYSIEEECFKNIINNEGFIEILK